MAVAVGVRDWSFLGWKAMNGMGFWLVGVSPSLGKISVIGSWSASGEHMVWVCLQRVQWSWSSRRRIIRAVAGLYHLRLGFLSHSLWAGTMPSPDANEISCTSGVALTPS